MTMPPKAIKIAVIITLIVDIYMDKLISHLKGKAIEQNPKRGGQLSCRDIPLGCQKREKIAI